MITNDHIRVGFVTWQSWFSWRAVILMMAMICGGGPLRGQLAWNWESVEASGGPDARSHAVVVWTGSELLVWGGNPLESENTWLGDGWSYSPAADAWTPMTDKDAPSVRQNPTGVWTGTELMIWGGYGVGNRRESLASGACYNPATKTWQAVESVGAPDKRGDHTMTWTGSEVIVWGGYDLATGVCLNNGARYDPLNHTWTSMALRDAPSPRRGHTAVWTGAELIVWGGGVPTSAAGRVQWHHLADFARYLPTNNTWQTGTAKNGPAPRTDHVAVWTGGTMIIWGGWNGSRQNQHLLADGAALDPAARSWTPLPDAGAPAARAAPACVWTGRDMIIWGGESIDPAQSGAIYQLAADAWSTLPATNSPGGATAGSAAWTGTTFYVFHDGLTRGY